MGEELADVLLYLVRLADTCAIDLGAAALAKMEKNAAKYPVERCRGSSKKYTAYAGGGGAAAGGAAATAAEQEPAAEGAESSGSGGGV